MAPITPSNISITERIIDLFGGIRPMAAKLDTPVTTVQGWKKRGIIPQARHADILAAAAREGIALDAAELSQTDPGAIAAREGRVTETASMPDGPAPQIIYRRSLAGIAALALSVLVVILSASGGFTLWRFYLQPLQTRVAALEAHDAASPSGNDQAGKDLAQRVANLEADLSRKPTNVAPPAAAGATPMNGGDADRIAAIEQQLAELKTAAGESEQLAKHLSELQVTSGSRELLAQSIRDIQSSTAATQGEVERLAAQFASIGVRLDKVDAALAERRQQALRAEAVMLGVGQLRAALRESQPFSKEIAALRPLIGADAEMGGLLDRIQPLAGDGVQTIGELKTDFDHLAPNIVRSAVIGDGASWWRQALYHVESVISIRRVGEAVPGDKADAIVARAEAKLEEDDLQGAVAALQTLGGMPADVAQPWVESAGQRITADDAESELTRIAIDRLASGIPQASGAPVSAAVPAQEHQQ